MKTNEGAEILRKYQIGLMSRDDVFHAYEDFTISGQHQQARDILRILSKFVAG